jgi:hypothetical protein
MRTSVEEREEKRQPECETPGRSPGFLLIGFEWER